MKEREAARKRNGGRERGRGGKRRTHPLQAIELLTLAFHLLSLVFYDCPQLHHLPFDGLVTCEGCQEERRGTPIDDERHGKVGCRHVAKGILS